MSTPVERDDDLIVLDDDGYRHIRKITKYLFSLSSVSLCAGSAISGIAVGHLPCSVR
jgi:hypothetical protein